MATGQEILNNNMFAYCNNSPVTYTDPSGSSPIEVDITNSHVMVLDNKKPCYGGPLPWDRDGNLIDTPVTRAKEWYEKKEELGYVHLGKGAKDIVTGTKNIIKGAEKLFVPCPTLVDDIVGVGQATYGIILIASGVTKTIIGVIRWDSNE